MTILWRESNYVDRQQITWLDKGTQYQVTAYHVQLYLQCQNLLYMNIKK